MGGAAAAATVAETGIRKWVQALGICLYMPDATVISLQLHFWTCTRMEMLDPAVLNVFL